MGKFVVIAHRGANREAHENTMQAFSLAAKAGAQRLELDVQASADGELVVYHDEKTPAVGGTRRLALKNLALGRIRQLLGQDTPVLAEVIEELGGRIELNIEIKPRELETAAAVGRALRRLRPVQRIIISSFRWQPLEFLCREFPEFERACLLERANPGIRARYGTVENFMAACGARILHPPMPYVNEALMDRATRLGWEVCTWAAMRAEENGRERSWQRLLDLGVDGHCTNYPREMASWLKRMRRPTGAGIRR